ncbi:molybdopterin oxidoreductase family protein [Methylocella sp. CPCC 101449]|uniref:molybdopterin-containing oxidoreductase family protein n=1 Tax=Methylocella sp. CPCC 101449 TaxID=2987531 RepID=UPI002891AED5|nr:molybdopterin oxidoreductase family protein [Methylocella sp. CPCC 101449]MDT2021550.1 molybdopterin oxidoreductase family protein [Methylocella sp. CPCC 101449]
MTMNASAKMEPKIERRPSVCPHDCPSACALDVEVIDGQRIGRIHGAKDQSYTAGVICAKVARYAERVHHPERLLHPLKRIGAKGEGRFQRITWDEALDEIGRRFNQAEQTFGPESIWLNYYAGTMGKVMKDGINRLAHAKKYSRHNGTICVNLAWPGFLAGTGFLAGPDPREMAKSDCVVIWGTNAVSTQVNVMTHALRARKERKAKIVVIDIYQNDTMKQADMALCLRPGSDGALACAVMHILFRDGLADRAYLDKYTDAPAELEAHLATRGPDWASAITGLSVDEIEAFAKLVGTTKKTYFRLGYGFSRQRNGASNMHAAASIAAVAGSWQYEGGGAFHNNGGIYRLKLPLVTGADVMDPSTRWLDQSRVGAILCGDEDALKDGPPVKAMLIQNTNPVSVAPDQTRVKQGFAREDLFLVVHEQFMTETALMADIVLPATMFLEHDDIYTGGGHQYIELAQKLVDPPGECRTNHDVICAIAARVGAEHPGFAMTPREHIDAGLRSSGWGSLEELEKINWRDVQTDFETAHFLNGFGWPDRKYHFKADWSRVPFGGELSEEWRRMPVLPDHWDVNEKTDAAHPFKLATSPSRSFLNSSFNETPSSLAREGRPTVLIHPEDAAALTIVEGDKVVLGNVRGEVRLHARIFPGLQRGVLISEGIWPNHAFEDGKGINTLTRAETPAPFGGAAFHDNHVWIRRTN